MVLKLVDEELLADVDQRPVYNPSIDLMEEDFMAIEQNTREHVLDHRIAGRTPLMQGVK